MTEVIETIDGLNQHLALCRLRHHTIALVPTMGALHEGHLRLIEEARARAHEIVVSIFVNPTQFHQAEDYELYPRNLENDIRLCREANVEFVFAPSGEEMYPFPLSAFVDVPALTEHLCGPLRPGHFRAVATVVMKLFQIVRPDVACFGEKDAQQLAVVRRMVRDLNIPVTIVPVGTVRESDGLAMSSRNLRLRPDDRRVAPMLYRALRLVAAEIYRGASSVHAACEKAREFLAAEPRIRLEYLELVDPEEMRPVTHLRQPMLIVIAAWLGGVRLIDNFPAPHSR